MDNGITITLEGVIFVLGAIVTLGGAVAVISRWFAPIKKLKKDVEGKVNQADFDALKCVVTELKSFQNTDHKELHKIEIGIEKTCKCVLAITDHELTGNSIDKLREAKDEMQDYLIQK